jgi:hypothetical protein
MLVITPLTSLFKIICLTLAFSTVLPARLKHAPSGEYLALLFSPDRTHALVGLKSSS